MRISPEIVCYPSPAYRLHITAKRYTPTHAHTASGRKLTLILLHSTSFHKEIWEPTIRRLFARTTVPIHEIYAIECPNHGHSAVLNELLLDQLPEYRDFSCIKYAQAVHHFLSHQLDVSNRNLICAGHSLGGVAATYLQSIHPMLPFTSIILIEPMLSPSGLNPLLVLRKMLVKSAYERRDVFESRANARKIMRGSARMTKWHSEVFDSFIEHALRDHPGSTHPIAPYKGVSLACTRAHEVGMYRDKDGPTGSITSLNETCARMPVHLIFGDVNDYIPRTVQEDITDPTSGRRFASITRIPGVGHLVPQEAPDLLTDVLVAVLVQNSKRLAVSSKL